MTKPPQIVFVAERSPDGRPPLMSPGGEHLAELCGLRSLEDLRARADIVNLMPPGRGAWDGSMARRMAAFVAEKHFGKRFILLGQRVVKAWGLAAATRYHWGLYYAPEGEEAYVATMPHPSGKCREWLDKAEVARARAFLRPLFKGRNGR